MSHEFTHTSGRATPVRGRTLYRGLQGLVLATCAAAGVAGCSMSVPMGSLVAPEDSVTGTLPSVPFAPLLDEEDRRREKAALATALDPQGDGSTVHWENPKSGSKGSFTASGHAYPMDSKICRAFAGEMKRGDLDRSMQGTACTVAAGEWAVRDMKPKKKA